LKPGFSERKETMPLLFIGHGSPMNAIEDNEFSREWARVGGSLPRPEAVLCVSAHWETGGTRVTAMEKPKTIHDFYGFPPELFAREYPAPGSPELARLARATAGGAAIELDSDWGLDHGAWSVLSRMFPGAEIPVVQMSLDRAKPPEYHYELGRSLRPLRNRGVLIVGSGNIVHNLRALCWDGGDRACEWASDFDETVKRHIARGDHDPVVRYELMGDAARLSIPTNEHFLPLLYVLGARDPGERPVFFTEKVTMCSLSMRSIAFG
jgi:4,5-DOPA dioxygenase extradiol